uniref:Protein kinase domain-containing protein n=1 Tax=Arcella intermedia TaxID=1963864 RepID=A0A6B2LBK4_9EUKA
MSDTTQKPEHAHEIAKSEISIFHQLQTHPNIVKFYEAFMVKKGYEYWIVMEYMDCNTLFDIVTHQHYLTTIWPTESQIARICCEILKGLHWIHTRNIIHKDIKSENILFNENGDIKIADFGNSCRLDEDGKAEEQEAVGTCHWMAPEIILEKAHNTKADIWSFGIVLHEILVGLPPYNEVKEEELKNLICNHPIPSPWEENDIWSSPLQSLYNKCIIKDYNQRASAKELLEMNFFRLHDMNPQALKDLIFKLGKIGNSKEDSE